MKRFLFLSVILAMGLAGAAQNRQVVKAETPLVGTAYINEAYKGIDEVPIMSFAPSRALPSNPNRDPDFPVDVQTMMTHYDLQTNAIVANRMYRHNDGTVGLVATWSQASNLNDRGTGYDYYNGNDFIYNESYNSITSRIESMKTGWPSYAPYGSNGEIVVSHTGSGLVYYTRTNKGSGTWQGPNYIPNPTNLPGPSSGVELSWPRIATSGSNHNILHVIAADSDNDNVYLYYSRSTNGVNWTTTMIPTLDSWERTVYGADTYALATNGNNVAIMLLSVSGHGYIIKSTNNGETWSKIKFWNNPYAGDWKNDPNTLFGNNNEIYIDDTEQYGPKFGSITIDNNGMVHGAFSAHKYAHVELGSSYTYWSSRTIDGIFYWNESMGTMQGPRWVCPDDGYVIPSNPHNICRMWWPTDESGEYITRNWESANLVGFLTPDDHFFDFSSDNWVVSGYFPTPSTSPAICVDETGIIGIAYSVPDLSRGYSSGGKYLRSIMVSFIEPPYQMGDATGNYSEIPGDCYYEYVKLQNADSFFHYYDEAIYPVCPTNIANGEFWFAYQADDVPGLYCGSNATQSYATDNFIWATKVIPDFITTTYYTISATANPTNGGTITGAGSYASGSTCTLHANANSGYSFVKWTRNGTQVSTNPNYSFTVTGNASYVAHFQQSTTNYTITATASPSNAGTITGTGTYASGSTCTLHASPNSGYTFVNWLENGTVVSSNANYSFTVTGNRNLVAVFDASTYYYTISVIADPSNGGTVSGGGSYASGGTCTLRAEPNNGYTFRNWTKNGTQVSSNPIYSFTVTDNASFVAHFDEIPVEYTITASADPILGGAVSGAGTYTAGSTCMLSAMPNSGFVFENWTRNDVEVSTSPSYSFTVNRNADYVAHFRQDANHVTITTMAYPVEGGAVSGGGTYEFGATCTLNAMASVGYEFVKWTLNGSQVSTNASFSFTVTANAVYTAHFVQTINHYTVAVSVEPSGAGSVSGAGTYEEGITCTLTANPNPTYSFESWKENGTVISTDPTYSFTVNRDRSLVATFSQGLFYTISASAGPNGSISPEGDVFVQPGEDKSFTMIPNSGCRVKKVVVDGTNVGPVESYTFRNVNVNHTIRVEFSGLGVEDNNIMNLKVYPNPAYDKIYVESPDIKRITIFNLFGVQMDSKEVNDDSIVISTSNFSQGTYILKVEDNEGRIGYSRFVVAK